MPIDFMYVKFLIWIFAGGLLISRITTRKHIEILGQRRERWSVTAAILFVVPLVYWCATRNLGIGDTGAYFNNFNSAPSSFSGIPKYLGAYTKDQWFYAFGAVIKCIFGSNAKVYFGIVGAIQLLCLALIYRKYSRNYWMSIFLFVASTDYTAWMFNGMRQFLAAAISFTALPLIVQKKYIPSILIVLLAAQFHQSALILLPVIFIVQGKAWNKKTLLIALGSLIAVAFIDQFTGFLDEFLQDTQYKNVVSDWESFSDDGTNTLRVLVYAVPTILSLIWRNRIEEADNPLIHICVNMSIVSTGIYIVSMFTSGIYIGRLPIYFSLYNYILLPWELRHCFQKNSRVAATASMVVFYLLFYLYSYM